MHTHTHTSRGRLGGVLTHRGGGLCAPRDTRADERAPALGERSGDPLPSWVREGPTTTPVSHASDKIGLNLSDCPIGGGGDCCADGRGAATRCPAPHPESVCPTHSALRLQIIRGAWRRREAPHTHTHTQASACLFGGHGVGSRHPGPSVHHPCRTSNRRKYALLRRISKRIPHIGFRRTN